jgi:hypothetical protein
MAAKGITKVIFRAEYKDPRWEVIKDEYTNKITFRGV